MIDERCEPGALNVGEKVTACCGDGLREAAVEVGQLLV